MSLCFGDIVQLIDYHTLAYPRQDQYFTNRLFELGLIETVHCPEEEIRPTERGKAYLQMVLDTPLPESRWVDPRVEKDK